MTKVIEQDWTTTLSVAELASWFKAVAVERYEDMGRAAKRATRGRSVDFFTPRAGDDPFAAFEQQPALSVGVTMPRGGSYAASAEPVTLHMYVTDDGSKRSVQFTLPVSTGMERFLDGRRGFGAITKDPMGHSPKSARILLEHFVESLVATDAQAHPKG